MHSRKNEEPEEFKVVDRRLFTSEGELRTDLPPETAAPEAPPKPSPSEAKEPAPKPASAPSSATPPTSATAAAPLPAAAPDTPGGEQAKEPSISQPADSQPGAGEVVQFQHLIMSLVSSAMYQLGMAARPGEVAPPPDLPGARETIDILAVLAQKTKGNLTREEDELLTGSLQELRLAFVELSRRAGRIR